MSDSPALLAVFGNPIAHSLSPLIHEFFAKQEGRQIIYEKRLVAGEFATSAAELFAHGGIGCNITVPCKVAAFHWVQEKTERALIAQAVNTIKKVQKEDGSVHYLGDNTDGLGLFTDLQRLNCPLNNARVLVLGAGGATRGIVPVLLHLGQVQDLTIVNRTVSKAEEIMIYTQQFAMAHPDALTIRPIEAHDYASLEVQEVNENNHYDVIINATSLSMRGELPALKDDYFRHAKFAYDLFYTPQGQTVFTEHARQLGIDASFDGLGMLVGQAALAYELWFGVRPELAPTIEYMRKVLAERV